MAKSEINFWIWMDSNLDPFIRTLAHALNYDLHPDELIAITEGAKRSDVEKDEWYEYYFDGNERVDFKLAREDGSYIIFISIECSETFVPVANILEYIFTKFYIK